MATTKAPATKDGGGSDSPQRTDYKKTTAPSAAKASKQNINTYSKMGKGLGSKSLGIFGMDKK